MKYGQPRSSKILNTDNNECDDLMMWLKFRIILTFDVFLFAFLQQCLLNILLTSYSISFFVRLSVYIFLMPEMTPQVATTP